MYSGYAYHSTQAHICADDNAILSNHAILMIVSSYVQRDINIGEELLASLRTTLIPLKRLILLLVQ